MPVAPTPTQSCSAPHGVLAPLRRESWGLLVYSLSLLAQMAGSPFLARLTVLEWKESGQCTELHEQMEADCFLRKGLLRSGPGLGQFLGAFLFRSGTQALHQRPSPLRSLRPSPAQRVQLAGPGAPWQCLSLCPAEASGPSQPTPSPSLLGAEQAPHSCLCLTLSCMYRLMGRF